MKMMQIKMTPLGPKSGGARAPPAPPVPTALVLGSALKVQLASDTQRTVYSQWFEVADHQQVGRCDSLLAQIAF